MLRVLVSYHVSPGKDSQSMLSDTGVDRSSIASIPDDESVVLTNTSQEAFITRKSKSLNALLHALENSNRL
jgi:hypothetical protein